MATVACDHCLGSAGEATDRLGRRYLRSLIEDDNIKKPQIRRDHLSYEDRRHSPTRAETGKNIGRASEELARAEVAALIRGLSPDKSGLIGMVIHSLDHGFGNEPVNTMGRRVAVPTIGLREFIAVAGMCAAIKSSEPSIFKFEIIKDT